MRPSATTKLRTLALGLPILLAACGGTPLLLAPENATPAECRALFQRFDALREYFQSTADRSQSFPLLLLGQEMKQAGCVTFTREIPDLDSVETPPPAPPGATIPATYLHAGVVTNMDDDARVVAFFNARGVPARSQGSPALGRRVYLGPFRSQGALETAARLAERAGFTSAYASAYGLRP